MKIQPSETEVQKHYTVLISVHHKGIPAEEIE
jgi:hypothetical protein